MKAKKWMTSNAKAIDLDLDTLANGSDPWYVTFIKKWAGARGVLERWAILKNCLERWARAVKWVGALSADFFRFSNFFSILRNFQGQFLKRKKSERWAAISKRVWARAVMPKRAWALSAGDPCPPLSLHLTVGFFQKWWDDAMLGAYPRRTPYLRVFSYH